MTNDEITHKTNHLEGPAESASMYKFRDQDKGKGAVETDRKNQGGNTNMSGQLGHRDENAELKNADSDLPG